MRRPCVLDVAATVSAFLPVLFPTSLCCGALLSPHLCCAVLCLWRVWCVQLASWEMDREVRNNAAG